MIDDDIEKALKCLENDLAASAAGFPGVYDDITTYIRAEMIGEGHTDLVYLILKENGYEKESRDYFAGRQWIRTTISS
jgi:hypothetical protein